MNASKEIIPDYNKSRINYDYNKDGYRIKVIRTNEEKNIFQGLLNYNLSLSFDIVIIFLHFSTTLSA